MQRQPRHTTVSRTGRARAVRQGALGATLLTLALSACATGSTTRAAGDTGATAAHASTYAASDAVRSRPAEQGTLTAGTSHKAASDAVLSRDGDKNTTREAGAKQAPTRDCQTPAMVLSAQEALDDSCDQPNQQHLRF